MKTDQTIFWVTMLTDCGASSKITADCIGKMEKGESRYGEWEPSEDTRDFIRETVEEVQDAINYCVMYMQKKTREGSLNLWEEVVIKQSIETLVALVEDLETHG